MLVSASLQDFVCTCAHLKYAALTAKIEMMMDLDRDLTRTYTYTPRQTNDTAMPIRGACSLTF